MEKTVVALFDNLDAAQTAVQELIHNGFSRDDISVVRTNQQGDYTSGNVVEDADGEASGAAAGAGIGAVLGGLAGLLVGLGALAIPGIGPIIAAGPLATALAGAGLGAATGGLVGALADAGIPEGEAGHYAEGVRRGGTLVTVRAGEDRVSRATEVLNRFTPVDINQRATEWQSSGWSGYDANAGPYSTTGSQGATMGMAAGGTTGAGMGADAAATSDMSGTRQANDYRGQTGYTGEASGGTYEGTGSAGYTGAGTTYRGTGSFTSNTQPAASQDAQPGGRDFSQASRDQLSSYDRTMGDMSRGFDSYDRDFRSDWERSYRASGFGYERFQPAYQYGYNLATDAKYRSRNWGDIERDARRDWEMRHPNDAWDDFKDAVQHAWNRVRTGVQDALD